MNKKFKVGDRVVGVGTCCGLDINGKVGTVAVVTSSGDIGIQFDDHIGGHNLGGHSKNGHGWWVCHYQIKPVQDEVIVIYRKDDSVIALNKATGEKTTARCHPDDKFDFEIGAKVAFDRLVGSKEPEPKYYSGKLVCIGVIPGYAYTLGKIYEVQNGVICLDNKLRVTGLTNLEDINKKLYAKFIEVVE